MTQVYANKVKCLNDQTNLIYKSWFVGDKWCNMTWNAGTL